MALETFLLPSKESHLGRGCWECLIPLDVSFKTMISAVFQRKKSLGGGEGRGGHADQQRAGLTSHCNRREGGGWPVSPTPSPRWQNSRSAWRSWKPLYAVIRMLRSGALLHLFRPSHPEP